MLKRISAKKLVVIGCILLAVALVLYVLCAAHKGEQNILNVLSEKVDLQIKNFHYTEVGDPDLTWEIIADTATYIKKDDVTHFENFKATLAFSRGDTYTITGNNGSLHTDTKDMDIHGNVVAVSDKGDRFETESLSYTHSNEEIRSKDAVKMTRPGVDLKGKGIHISLKDKKVTLLSDVRAILVKTLE